MIRTFTVAAGALALTFATPATAAVTYQFRLGGFMTVDKFTDYPDPTQRPASCAGQVDCYFNENVRVNLSEFQYVVGSSNDGIHFTISALGGEGTNFEFGGSGTATYLGQGVYRGDHLEYQGEAPFSGVKNVSEYGTTTSFQVYQISPPPVPEPSTWALLLVGFGAIGGLARGRRKLAPEFA